MSPTDLWISLREKLLNIVSGSDRTKNLNLQLTLHVVQGFPDALVDDHLLPFTPLMFLDPKAWLDVALVIQKMGNLQFEQIGDTQRGIDANDKQQ